MRIWAMMRKDVFHQFRSGFSLIMMFAAPLLITGLIYAAFNGILGTGSSPQIAQIRVQVVNLDHGDYGAQLINTLQGDRLQSVLRASVATDEATARAAIIDKTVDVVVIIPADFSRNPDSATVKLVHDSAQTIGPHIVESILNQYLEMLNGARIAAQTTSQSLARAGITVDGETARSIATQYVAAQSQPNRLMTVNSIANQQTQPQTTLIATIAVSMMIFFMFFTGAQIAQSIITEQEQGTLARLFTTSVRLPTLLVGKMGAAWLTLAVQAVILLGASALLFGFRWGDLAAIVVIVTAMVVACASFGLLVIAFIKNARQAGTIIGGVLTLTGMLGGLFTGVLPNNPGFINVSSLLLPQGWAIQGWKHILAGGTVSDVLLSAAALLVIAVICFVIANITLRKRFA